MVVDESALESGLRHVEFLCDLPFTGHAEASSRSLRPRPRGDQLERFDDLRLRQVTWGPCQLRWIGAQLAGDGKALRPTRRALERNSIAWADPEFVVLGHDAPPDSARSIASAAPVSSSGTTAAYALDVMAIPEWPSHSLITAIGTPAARSAVAAECRRS